jgi:hypothetical protein
VVFKSKTNGISEGLTLDFIGVADARIPADQDSFFLSNLFCGGNYYADNTTNSYSINTLSHGTAQREDRNTSLFSLPEIHGNVTPFLQFLLSPLASRLF